MNHPLRNFVYILTVESVCRCDQRRRVEADRDPQNIWDLQKKLWIFHRCYIIGTVTNKANNSI